MQKSRDHDDNYLLDVESNSLRVILVHCDDMIVKFWIKISITKNIRSYIVEIVEPIVFHNLLDHEIMEWNNISIKFL